LFAKKSKRCAFPPPFLSFFPPAASGRVGVEGFFFFFLFLSLGPDKVYSPPRCRLTLVFGFPLLFFFFPPEIYKALSLFFPFCNLARDISPWPFSFFFFPPSLFPPFFAGDSCEGRILRVFFFPPPPFLLFPFLINEWGPKSLKHGPPFLPFPFFLLKLEVYSTFFFFFFFSSSPTMVHLRQEWHFFLFLTSYRSLFPLWDLWE